MKKVQAIKFSTLINERISFKAMMGFFMTVCGYLILLSCSLMIPSLETQIQYLNNLQKQSYESIKNTSLKKTFK